ncbi:hypothetical protein METP2_01197 [Methanosarcinales archaeon]|nr:hypothetical protein METP2_01197 [Methanosarcinales archaeon]
METFEVTPTREFVYNIRIYFIKKRVRQQIIT